MKARHYFAGLVGLMLAGVAVADSVTLKDGTQIDGNILSQSDTQVYISEKSGPRHVPIKDIARYEWRGKKVVLAEAPAPAKAPAPVTQPAATPAPAEPPAPVVVAPVEQAAPIPAPTIKVHFSPDGGCTDAICRAIDGAKKHVRIQAYSFTSAPIAKAIIEAKKRGVEVTAVLDKSNRSDKYSSATFLKNQGCAVVIDDSHAIAHNKVILIDDDVIITGSFNFSKAAEESNAENLLIISGMPDLFAQYAANFERHQEHSKPYQGLAVAESTLDSAEGTGTTNSTATDKTTSPRATAPTPTPAPRTTYNDTTDRRDTYGGTRTSDTTATGLQIYTGPRGGRYHISKSGKKVYEKRK